MTGRETLLEGDRVMTVEPETGDGSWSITERIRNYGRLSVAPVVALLMIGLSWHFILVWTGTRSFIFPKPLEVFEAGWDNRTLLWASVRRTAQAATTGLVLAIIGGVFAAVILHVSNLLERSLVPYFVVLQTTPIVAIAPVIVIQMGPGIQSISAIAFVISFFPMLSNTLVGLHSVDEERRNAFRLYHANRRQTLLKLEFPTALPFILAGARISAGLSVIGAIVGEFVAGIGGGRGGLGYVIAVSARHLDTDYLFSAAFAGSLLGITFYALIGLATRLLLGNWHESQVTEAGGPRAGG